MATPRGQMDRAYCDADVGGTTSACAVVMGEPELVAARGGDLYGLRQSENLIGSSRASGRARGLWEPGGDTPGIPSEALVSSRIRARRKYSCSH